MKIKLLIVFFSVGSFAILAILAIRINRGDAVDNYKIEQSQDREKELTVKIDSLDAIIQAREGHIQILLDKLYSQDTILRDSLSNLSVEDLGKMLRQ